MTGGEDISWQALGRIVREWAGDPAELTEVIPLTGGSVNNTLLLVTGDFRKAVLKITPHRINRQVEVEAFQLDLLRGLGIPVPRVYQCHVASLENPNSYLLMEYIDGVTLSEAKKRLTAGDYDALEQELADLTAGLHQQTREHYGKVDGSGNHLTDNWPAFYRSLHDQAVQVTAGVKDIPMKLRKKIEKLHERLEKYLAHSDRPRLLHGDLWSANVMCRPDDDGQWKIAAVLDPNLRYGHAESELAYLELFETSNTAFKKTYQRTHKLDEDYHRVRKSIYQLYPLIDHVQIFGRKYVEPMMKIADRATAVM